MTDFYTWNIHGISIPFDMEDAETAQKYQDAAPIIEQFGNSDTLSNEVERILADCAVVRSFFAAIFDTETADAIFKDIPDNRRKYLDVFDSFVTFVYRQSINAAQRMLRIQQQYVPGMRNGDTDESVV
ncbi:MAG: hypothetical protein Q4D37_05610 [Oscillospiraceae bacterium]|nr:hypothetical protein [Oscillospiraceae bacterium]